MNDRRDDWRNSVDERLVSLTTAQKVTDKQLDDLELNYKAIDKVLRGDPNEQYDGLIARLHAIENGINKLDASINRLSLDIHGDHTGHPGIKQELRDIKEGRTDRRERRADWLKFSAAIGVAILALAGTVVGNWDKIVAFWREHEKPSPLERTIERAKHKKGRPIVKIRHIQAEDVEDSD